MNVRLKMTRSKATGLYAFLTQLIERYEPKNIAEMLLEDHMKDIHERLEKKVKSSYTTEFILILNPKESKAYYLFFNQNKIDLGASFLHEQNLVHSQILLMDKLYARR